MKYRRLGRTGLEISEIVFGAGFVGGVLIHQGEAMGREALERARALGIDWIDTAPSYGDGKSESALGKLLPAIGWQPRLSTKFRLEPGGPAPIATQIETSVEASLARLGVDSVDMLQLHNPLGAETDERHLGIDRVLEAGGVADVMDDLRRRAITRHLGFTALGDAATLRRMVASHRFDTAQVYYNLLNPSAGRTVSAGWSSEDFGDVIATCQAHDVGVLVIRVMAAGILATDERTGREMAMYPSGDVASEEGRAGAVRAALVGEPGNRAQAAIRFALGHAGISAVLIGPSVPDHLDEAARAVDMAALAPETLARLAQLHDGDFGRLG